MDHDPLATYLQDHLAGATSAIEILERLRDDHAGKPVGEFASALLSEVQEDRATLERMANRLGGGYSRSKEAVAWVGSKISHVKLGWSIAGDFGVFQALEMVSLGISGKLALWQALAVVAEQDYRLDRNELHRLSARAEAQHSRVEERRLAMARSTLRAASEQRQT